MSWWLTGTRHGARRAAGAVLRWLILAPLGAFVEAAVVTIGEVVLRRMDHDYDHPIEGVSVDAGDGSPGSTAEDGNPDATDLTLAGSAVTGTMAPAAVFDGETPSAPAPTNTPDELHRADGGTRAPHPAGGDTESPGRGLPRIVNSLGPDERDAVWRCEELTPPCSWEALYRWNIDRWEYNVERAPVLGRAWRDSTGGGGQVTAMTICSGTRPGMTVRFIEQPGHPERVAPRAGGAHADG